MGHKWNGEVEDIFRAVDFRLKSRVSREGSEKFGQLKSGKEETDSKTNFC